MTMADRWGVDVDQVLEMPVSKFVAWIAFFKLQKDNG